MVEKSQAETKQNKKTHLGAAGGGLGAACLSAGTAAQTAEEAHDKVRNVSKSAKIGPVRW